MNVEELIRVLVVEDDPQMAALLQRGLREEGYEVFAVSEGLQALIEAQEHAPRIAVVDVMLPGMNGFELCQRLRQADPTLRVMMLTARDDVDDRVRGLDAGADDYLTKPFAFSELAARLRALLRRDAAVPQTQFQAGNIALDVLELTVTAGQKVLHLSPKEFALLKLLMQNLNQPVSRNTILTEIWGTTEHAHANVVDQYVSYLRKKLDALDASATGSGVSILTERGVGFRLTEV